MAEDFAQTCAEEFLIAEPSILHVLELKEKFGDQIHCTFLTSSRAYRQRLLEKRQTETPQEIVRRLDEGDGQTFVALLLAGKNVDFIRQFVSPEITTYFERLLTTPPTNWNKDGFLDTVSKKIGPELVGILESVVTHKGRVVDELINIDRFQTFIDDIVVLEDKFITDNPYQAGLFSEAVIDTATRMLLNADNKVFSVDQTASANIICNLVVPEASKSVESVMGVPYADLFDSIVQNQKDRMFTMKTLDGVSTMSVRWVSYFEDRMHVFGLVLQDPNHPDSVMSFKAMQPEGSDEALLEYQIDLSPLRRASDRSVQQMAFMSQALRLCARLGVKKFHYAEHFDLVDVDDNVIGIVPRHTAHEEGRYIHRAASVMIWRWHYDTEKGKYVKELFLTKRSKNKKLNPNKWHAAPSGHLLPGETYAEAARRELKEEMGTAFSKTVKAIQPLTLVRAYSNPVTHMHPQKENFYYFLAQVDHDASESINANYESDSAKWMSVDDIRNEMKDNPSYFRDAFRMAFSSVDWNNIAEPPAPPKQELVQAPTAS